MQYVLVQAALYRRVSASNFKLLTEFRLQYMRLGEKLCRHDEQWLLDFVRIGAMYFGIESHTLFVALNTERPEPK